jgi:hypothetical protein
MRFTSSRWASRRDHIFEDRRPFGFIYVLLGWVPLSHDDGTTSYSLRPIISVVVVVQIKTKIMTRVMDRSEQKF